MGYTGATLTAAEFERGYAARSGVTVEALRSTGRVVWPCDCETEICLGWMSISPEAVRDEVTLRGYPDRPGFPCAGCGGWGDPDAARAYLQVPPKPSDLQPGEPIYDGAVIARMKVYHERCAPSGAVMPALPAGVEG